MLVIIVLKGVQSPASPVQRVRIRMRLDRRVVWYVLAIRLPIQRPVRVSVEEALLIKHIILRGPTKIVNVLIWNVLSNREVLSMVNMLLFQIRGFVQMPGTLGMVGGVVRLVVIFQPVKITQDLMLITVDPNVKHMELV
jgi:hypothetical protein